MAGWRCQIQSIAAYRSDWHDLVARSAAAAELAVSVRLCQAGAGQFSSSAQSATRHGLGGGGRACDQYCARHSGCTGLPLHRLLADDRGAVDRREFKRADLEAIDLVR